MRYLIAALVTCFAVPAYAQITFDMGNGIYMTPQTQQAPPPVYSNPYAPQPYYQPAPVYQPSPWPQPMQPHYGNPVPLPGQR